VRVELGEQPLDIEAAFACTLTLLTGRAGPHAVVVVERQAERVLQAVRSVPTMANDTAIRLARALRYEQENYWEYRRQQFFEQLALFEDEDDE
jgi:hypothetical protein